ncbi:MAG: hypothetical protein H6807_07115 [Planctomycetes bacterium]|nr:hypothetical protein [Planctomycetota bacterium]
MSESTPEIETLAPARDRAATWLLAALLVALALLALPERLQVAEADLLVRVLDGEVAARAEKVQRVWSYIVGTMERPARLLGLLSAALTLVLLHAASRGLGRGGRVAALLGLAACVPFWTGALRIGGEGWWLPAGALPLALLRAARWHPAWASLGGGLAAGLLPFWLGGDGPRLAEFGLFVPDLGLPGPTWLPAALLAAAGLILVVLAGRRGSLPLVTLALASGPALVAARAELEAGALRPALLAVAPALGLALGHAVAGGGRRRAQLLILLLLAAAAITVSARERWPRARLDRDRLDQAATLLPEAGWLVLAGDRAPVLRYYEKVGHRTAARSFLARDQDEAGRILDQALLDQPPVILLVDGAPELADRLAPRYRPLAQPGLGPGLVLLGFARR